MPETRWERIKSVFVSASAVDEAQRKLLLDRECAGNDALRREVESLLAASVRDAVGTGAALDAMASCLPTQAAANAETVGTRIGPYKLLQMIGEGGFGTVFMAEQERPVRRRVALKIIKLGMDTRQVVARFEAERQALALMDHPHIARVLDAGTTESGRPYFVMEYVIGDPITSFADAHKLSVRERLELYTQVCQAVQHAHTKGIIHRDLKPGNVLTCMTDGRPFAKVIDFGIAKATGARLTDMTLFTAHRQLIGTPEYMSPEQAEGSPDLDTRTDVYALGVLLYELLTGTTPFDSQRLRSAALAEMQRIIKEEEPLAPSVRLSRSLDRLAATAAARSADPARLGVLIKGELDWIAIRALEKDRARRYETPAQIAADVSRHLAGEPILAAPPGAAYRLRKLTRRHKGAVAAAGLVAVVLVAATIVSASFALDARRQRGIATRERDRAIASEAETREQTARALESVRAEAAMRERTADAEAFTQCARLYPDGRAAFLFALPTPGAIRHMGYIAVEHIWLQGEAPIGFADVLIRAMAAPSSSLTKLRSLHVGWSATDAGLAALAANDTGLSNLHSLNLASSQVTNAGLEYLAAHNTGLKALATLDLSHTKVTDEGLRVLARAGSGLKALTTLITPGEGVTDEGVRVLARWDSGLQALTMLDLSYTRVTVEGLQALASAESGLKALTALDLSNMKVTIEGLQALASAETGLKALKTLNLSNTSMTNDGVKTLAAKETGLTALTALDFSYTQVTDDGVKELSGTETGLRILEDLDLSGTQVTDDGMKVLARADTGLKALTTLGLWSTKVTDEGLKALAARETGLKTLITLELLGTQVTDEGIKALAATETGLKALTKLVLQRTRVTDEGVKALAHAETGVKALNSLDLRNTQVTDDGVNALKERFPGITIVR